ncbi:hypothetical protein QR680_000638 [Steinernema hermaphroditum]|uniref:Uncharacterized protein n=1 Tax=Steinernema hermaphroditum TaxID=289476 RepID=A0AA39GVA7_9BILA|nr:hypothetical protein QR680_000638 [Steinernema hermaphroditum]
MTEKSEKTRRFSARTTALEVLENVDLSDKTILITGCTSGIGVETARALVLKGATLIMANRSVEASEELREKLYTETEHRKISIIQCDLSSLASVKKAAQEFLAKGCALDVLVLNAGVFAPNGLAVSKTTDGYESTFGVNHLGHFYLTTLLLPKLRESSYSRIVVVSSLSHNHTGIKAAMPIDEKMKALVPEGDIRDSCYKLYAYSKLCNVLFANRIARVEKEHGIHTYSLHPGTMIATNIQRSFGIVGKIYIFFTKFFTKSIAQGAATTTYCAAHPDVAEDSGRYYDGCWYEEKNYDSKLADDVEFQDALWKKSTELIENFEASIANVDAA